MRYLASWIAASPRFRLVVNLIATVLIGLFGNIYAGQIMKDGSVSWELVFRLQSLWFLIVVIVWVWLNIGFLQYDEDIARFADDEHCKAFVRKTNLEAYAKRVKSDPTQTRDARDLLKELGIEDK